MSSFLKNKIILVSGSAGSIGSALCKKISEQNPKLLLALDNNETALFDLHNKVKCKPILADVRDRGRLEGIMNQYRPEIVIHAAAYKHVGMLEGAQYEAVATNILGTKNVLEVSEMYGVKKFIFISTDKAVNPTSVMGKTKKIAEEACRTHKGQTKVVVVRFGNVVNSRGSVVEIWSRKIEEGHNLIVNHKDMRRYFMGIYEAVSLVLKATEIGRSGETIVLDMGEQMSIPKLADFMIKLSKKDLKIVYTKPSKGEKFKEELMTPSEKKRAKKVNKLWVIPQ